MTKNQVLTLVTVASVALLSSTGLAEEVSTPAVSTQPSETVVTPSKKTTADSAVTDHNGSNDTPVTDKTGNGTGTVVGGKAGSTGDSAVTDGSGNTATQPTTPAPSEQPSNPAQPATPAPSEQPSNPAQPTTPAPSEQPSNPAQPTTPAPSEQPSNPAQPTTPSSESDQPATQLSNKAGQPKADKPEVTAPSSSESDTPVVGKGEENDSSSRSGKSSKSSETDKPVDSKAETKPKPEEKSDKEKSKDPSGNAITELPHTGDSKAGTALFSSIGASLLAVALFLKRKLKS